TVDYQTLEDETVTIRDRDTAKQERIKISDIAPFVTSSFGLSLY
ncbi:MAG: His/Gly/Thr/Pro-type tRNA ligase C-terminal domain-containing protein, partial [Patescibacteria group bacterium]